MGAATADSKLNIKYIDGPHQLVFVTKIYLYGLTTIAYAWEKHVPKHILLKMNQLFYHQSSHVYHPWVSDTDTASVSALVSGAEELFQMEQVQCSVSTASTQCPHVPVIRDTLDWSRGRV